MDDSLDDLLDDSLDDIQENLLDDLLDDFLWISFSFSVDYSNLSFVLLLGLKMVHLF